jgi:hypothetical protein
VSDPIQEIWIIAERRISREWEPMSDANTETAIEQPICAADPPSREGHENVSDSIEDQNKTEHRRRER